MTSCCSATPRPQNRASEGHAALESLPVAIIGGGPVGLAAAAHLLERGLEPVILEAGHSIGTAPLAWGHVPMFSPWRYNIDRAAQALLERHGWAAPDPTASRRAASWSDATWRRLPRFRTSPAACG